MKIIKRKNRNYCPKEKMTPINRSSLKIPKNLQLLNLKVFGSVAASRKLIDGY